MLIVGRRTATTTRRSVFQDIRPVMSLYTSSGYCCIVASLDPHYKLVGRHNGEVCKSILYYMSADMNVTGKWQFTHDTDLKWMCIVYLSASLSPTSWRASTSKCVLATLSARITFPSFMATHPTSALRLTTPYKAWHSQPPLSCWLTASGGFYPLSFVLHLQPAERRTRHPTPQCFAFVFLSLLSSFSLSLRGPHN